MSLGGLYQRLLVAAGAVAFLVVNWFCKPVRHRPSHVPQESEAIETAPEQQALLEAKGKDDKDDELQAAGDAAPDAPGYEAPELSQLDKSDQLHTAAEVAPEDVVMEPVQAASSAPQRAAEDVTRQPTRSSAAAAASAAPPPSGGEPSAANPVDEDYLKSLLDQEFGPPKFPVPKPAPAAGEQQPASGEDRTLQELLDQAFGPPRFAVPKPESPQRGPLESEAASADAAPPGAGSAAQPTALAAATCAPSGSRTQAPGAAAAPAPAAAVAAGGVKRSAEELDRGVSEAAEAEALPSLGAPQGVTALTLSVTQGPASGKRVMAADPAAEYKIGRLPDSWLQVLDQEVSGRHAAVRWDSASSRWMLRDVGSLNGTALGGESIGREYKVPGDERPLSTGDCVTLGSVTQIRVELAESGTAVAVAAGGGAGAAAGAQAEPVVAAPAAAPAAAKRHHSGWIDGSSEVSGASTDRSHQETVVGLPGLPTPGALVDCPELGARLCVHNRLGVDHKRMSQGCEDVPHWELPFEPYAGAGIVCVFDGHHGSRAANQAKEHLPAILRAKLLRRDSRLPPPLPPPPPKPAPRKAEGEEDGEEDMMEAYDGASSEEVIQEEEEEGEGGSQQALAAALSGGSGGSGPGLRGLLSSGSGGAAGGSGGLPDRNGGGGSGPSESLHLTEVEAGAVVVEEEPRELLPPPPAGPPLPPLLRGRDMASQRTLLKDTFLLADQYMSMEEGCTATLVLLDRDAERGGWVLQSANVGDSSAVLVNFTRGSWCKLSEDHRIASSSSERERLARMGHTVRTRLYGLNISRMLGDRFLKEEDLGFLAEPYVGLTAQVGPTEHAVLIVASDGLWDVLSEERAAAMLLQEAGKSVSLQGGGGGSLSSSRPPGAPSSSRAPTAPSASASFTGGLAPPPAGPHPSSPSSSPSPSSVALGCQTVADMLLTKALALRSKDDITISVLELGPHLRPPADS